MNHPTRKTEIHYENVIMRAIKEFRSNCATRSRTTISVPTPEIIFEVEKLWRERNKQFLLGTQKIKIKPEKEASLTEILSSEVSPVSSVEDIENNTKRGTNDGEDSDQTFSSEFENSDSEIQKPENIKVDSQTIEDINININININHIGTTVEENAGCVEKRRRLNENEEGREEIDNIEAEVTDSGSEVFSVEDDSEIPLSPDNCSLFISCESVTINTSLGSRKSGIWEISCKNGVLKYNDKPGEWIVRRIESRTNRNSQ